MTTSGRDQDCATTAYPRARAAKKIASKSHSERLRKRPFNRGTASLVVTDVANVGGWVVGRTFLRRGFPRSIELKTGKMKLCVLLAAPAVALVAPVARPTTVLSGVKKNGLKATAVARIRLLQLRAIYGRQRRCGAGWTDARRCGGRTPARPRSGALSRAGARPLRGDGRRSRRRRRRP